MLNSSSPYSIAPAPNSKVRASKARRVLSNITNCRDSQQKAKEKAKSLECTFKGAIPAKKRIQVPQPSSLRGELEVHGDDDHTTHASARKCEQNVLSSGSRPNRSKTQIKRKESPNETEAEKFLSSSSRKAAKRAKKQSLSKEQSSPKEVVTETPGKEGKPTKKPIELDLSCSNTNTKRTRKRKGKDVVQLPCSQPSHQAENGSDIMPVREDSSRRKLDPFFWLRDESSQDTEAIQVTQLTLTQSSARPNFSDLKDSDDDHAMDANEEFSNGIGVCGPVSYDSDDFDWTQLPCSPEIRCSPSKNQGAQNDLVVDLPLEEPQLLAIEGPSSYDQDLVERSSQEIISTKSLLDIASRVPLIGQDNLNMVLKENRKCRKSSRAQSGPSKPDNSVVKMENRNDAKGDRKLAEGSEKDDNVVEPQSSVCVFCGSSKCSQITGPMMHYDHEGTPLEELECKRKVVNVHKHCAEWAPDVYFVEDQVKNLNAEAVRGLKLKCSSCGKKGAALGCCITRCRKSYHYPCARALSCKWEEECFIILCPEHKAENFPIKKRRQSTARRAAHNPKAKLNVEEPSHVGSCEENSTKWECGPSSKWVLCGSALDSDGKDQLTTFAKISGATVAKAWNSSVTHVIAGVDQHGACRRTMKYLLAILEGKWILKREWMAACIEAGNPVSEEPYEIGIDIHGAVGGPKQGRLLAARKASKVFGKMQFYFMRDFSPSYKGDLQALIAAGGGLILHRKPVFLETDAGQITTLVVYSNESPSIGKKVDDGKILSRRQEEAQSLAASVGACVVPHQWILDSIASSKSLPLE